MGGDLNRDEWVAIFGYLKPLPGFFGGRMGREGRGCGWMREGGDKEGNAGGMMGRMGTDGRKGNEFSSTNWFLTPLFVRNFISRCRLSV